MGAFAGIAALLAAVGLYGVLSSVVRQRLFLSAVGVAGGFTAALVPSRR